MANTDTEGVTLYGVWSSPFSGRVEIALRLKGIPYDYIEEDLQNKSTELVKYNPVYKKVPVLVHNGKPIAESQVILEYIEETWPGGYTIIPKDSYDRAMARFWAKFIDDKCLLPVWKAFWGPDKDEAAKEAQESLKILEREIEGKKLFGGDKAVLVDIVANFISRWVEALQAASGKDILLTKEKYPCLSQWAQEFTSCSVIKETLPPTHRLANFFKARFEAVKASK